MTEEPAVTPAVEAAARAMCDRVNGVGDYDDNLGKRRTGWMAQARAGIDAYISDARSCGASPDHADILETIQNAADDWQKSGYRTALAEVRDMANVGRALIQTIADHTKDGPLKGWMPMDDPAEVVADLLNMLDEAARSKDSATPTEQTMIYVRWSDDGHNIRKWQRTPFEYGVPVVAVGGDPKDEWLVAGKSPLADRATEIANLVCGGAPERCSGWKAKAWQAAWDGACHALGGDPADHTFDFTATRGDKS